MYGNHRPNGAYYLCWPKNNNRGRPDKYAGHPKAVYLREKPLMDAITGFFAERVFGPHRHEILAATLAGLDDDATHQRHAERERLQRHLADIARRQNSILHHAQNGDPNAPFTQGLRSTYNDLDTEKQRPSPR